MWTFLWMGGEASGNGRNTTKTRVETALIEQMFSNDHEEKAISVKGLRKKKKRDKKDVI